MDRFAGKEAAKEFEYWLEYVHHFAKAFVDGSNRVVTGEIESRESAGSGEAAHCRVLVCSPHPDDEALTGALPLRLSREGDVSVCNMAITLGSDQARKEARKRELEAACEVLNFDLLLASEPLGLEHVTAFCRGQDPVGWQRMVGLVFDHLHEYQPDMVLMPHDRDTHSTHIGVHFLVLAALMKYSQEVDKGFTVIETEFWHPMKDPNLLVGVKPDDVALLVTALSCHKGEIARNPYHLRLPARLMDTVRRGAELIGGRRQKAPDFVFGELYRISYLKDGFWSRSQKRRIVAPKDPIGLGYLKALFPFQ